MEAHPRLSIGIPVYNGEKLLDPRHRPCASARATSHPSVRLLRVRSARGWPPRRSPRRGVDGPGDRPWVPRGECRAPLSMPSSLLEVSVNLAEIARPADHVPTARHHRRPCLQRCRIHRPGPQIALAQTYQDLRDRHLRTTRRPTGRRRVIARWAEQDPRHPHVAE